MMYDNALLRAQTLLNQPDTTAAARLLDSLGRVPTDQFFAIERQKLRQLQFQLDSIRTAWHPRS